MSTAILATTTSARQALATLSVVCLSSVCQVGCSDNGTQREGLSNSNAAIDHVPTIHDWVEAGDSKKVRQLLDEDPDLIGAVYSEDLPDMPLHLAAWQGHTDVVRLLLDRGADVNACGDGGRTPLHYAAHHGHLEVIDLLLAAGADLSAVNDFGQTPLIAGAYSREAEGVDAAERLLERGAVLDLNSALALGRTDDVRRMLRDNPHAVDEAPLPTQLLHDATVMINGKLYEFHVEGSDADLRAVDRVVERDLDVVRMLVEQKPPVDPKMHYTALFTAVQLPHTGVAEILLEYDSDVERPGEGEMSKLSYIAGFSRRADEMRELLRRYGVE